MPEAQHIEPQAGVAPPHGARQVSWTHKAPPVQHAPAHATGSDPGQAH